MHAQASPTGFPDSAESGVRFLASLPDLVSSLLRDTLDLVALEGRAAAIRIALLVSFCVFAACFRALRVVRAVRDGLSSCS
jgi:hypothetical protein